MLVVRVGTLGDVDKLVCVRGPLPRVREPDDDCPAVAECRTPNPSTVPIDVPPAIVRADVHSNAEPVQAVA